MTRNNVQDVGSLPHPITERTASRRTVERRRQVVIRFAGDSGDGMQLAGGRFTAESAMFGNDIATVPDFPAEIRAPRGTVAGVSSFQLQFADHHVFTAGDRPDVLVVMNPAALKCHADHLPPGGLLIVNSDEFTDRNLARAGYANDPLADGTLARYKVYPVAMATMTANALAGSELNRKQVEQVKNMFALGLLCWMYHRPTETTERFIRAKFAGRPAHARANVGALRAGWNYGETTEAFGVTYEVAATGLSTGTYRQITGNTALAYGIVAAGRCAGLPVVVGAYPITPASDILHELAKHKHLDVTTVQAEDEIAGIGAALGAAYGGALGVTVTSGPGLALKSETIGLAVMTELPLIVVDVQRGGPSTGLPTKTEQADLAAAMSGRNGESPVPVLAAGTPGDCFATALDAARIALTYRTPVLLLSDGMIANGAEPWRVPSEDQLPDLRVPFATEPNATDGSAAFWPYLRDPATLARPWAVPGTPGLEHRIGGLEKAADTGEISYDADNHDLMVRTRAAKVAGIDVPDLVVDDPTGTARVLALGWGSTYGAIGAATHQVRAAGTALARAHLRHLNPFPANLGEVLAGYDQVVVPELNLGQLAEMLRARYLINVVSHTKVAGMPFRADDLAALFTDVIERSGKGERP
ncbi:MAG TPA: 2-oxoacid:acceptor oxidoreductase subunit alpha [Pseudonocardiaceae bacterium]